MSVPLFLCFAQLWERLRNSFFNYFFVKKSVGSHLLFIAETLCQ
ncbi:hypothetical protein IQ13_3256 [Lacibacter cauensis]|uniref:Uncharacterized protein n=1 Tax=Lacibacter cauensis TaxID=510947 RepID=A0A562SH20_9BACT|nr:hypothetical protein IQ13_3256 [Lacibacter cauensis]